MKLLKSTKWLYMVFCILFVAVGVVFVIWPEMSVSAIGYIIGAITLVFGIIRIIGYFTDDLYSIAFQFDLALGIFAVIVGIAFLTHPHWLFSAMPLSLGIFFLINGLFSVQSAIDAKRFGIRRWRIMLACAVVGAAFGILLIFNPFKSAVVMMRLTGIAFAVSGIEKLIVALITIKTKKNNKIEPIEVDYVEVKTGKGD